MTEQNSNNEEAVDQDKELQKVFPFFKSWRALYTFVLAELVVLIILFYLFSNYFS